MRYFSIFFLVFALLFQGVVAQAQQFGDPSLLTDQQLIQLFGAGMDKTPSVSQIELRARELGFTPAQQKIIPRKSGS